MQRPVTRSSVAKKELQKIDLGQKGSNASGRDKIELLISHKSYHDALEILTQKEQTEHWVLCKQAQIHYQLHHRKRAVCLLRESLLEGKTNCIQCLRLLTLIIRDCPGLIENEQDLIIFSAQCQEIPKELRAELNVKLKEVSPQNTLSSSSPHSDFQSLLRVYYQRGARFPKLQLREIHKGYRVAVARESINPRENIIFVPKNQIITLEIARAHPHVKKILPVEYKLKSPKHCILSAFLLFQKNLGHDSQYFQYISCLPKEISNFPVYFEENLLAELEGTNFVKILSRKKEDILEDFKQISSYLKGSEQHFEFDDFLWARMMISSRIFGIQIAGLKTDALVPIADMLNHQVPKTTSWLYSERDNGFVVVNIDEKIPKGAEIFDSYGSKCNSRFFLNYGFVQPNNSYNEVHIKLKKYKNYKVPPPILKISQNLENSDLLDFLEYYRKAILEFKNSPDSFKNISQLSGFICQEIQEEAWENVIECSKDTLKQYKTSIKADEKLLKEQSLSFNMRNCIQIRLGEKRVLDFYIKMGKDILSFFRKKQATITKQYQKYSTYLQSLNKND